MTTYDGRGGRERLRLVQSIPLLSLLMLPVPPAAAQEALDQDKDVAALEEVVVIGARLPGRSAQDSPVPVDVLTGDDFRNYGVRDMDSLLSATVPSYNVNQQPISDAATLVRPANLRGLPPDSTLILVNGKRRHRASVITFLGGGISDGSHAPDLAVIPAIALKRVEVLRDGAAAQYGSDAVAGVMNFVLKDAPDSGTVETRWGQFYKGDGDTFNIAGNLGMPLPLPFIQSGFTNFSFEYNNADPTSRSVQRDDAQKLIDKDNKHVQRPAAQIWGAPEVHYDYKLFGNLGLNLNSKTEVYAFGNYAQRKVEGGFFFRNPGTVELSDGREGVFVRKSNENNNTIYKKLIINPKTGKPCETEDEEGCYSFVQRFPGGFTPTFGGVVRDWSAAWGIRGDTSHTNVWLNNWHYDISAVFGQHSTDFFMTNTINPQLVRRGMDIPTEYKPGAYIERDRVVNLDISRALENSVFASPLNVAFGMEYREEEFEIEAGEENSWFKDEKLAAQGFGIGSNGFPGFPPEIAGKNDRGSYAAYLDLETDVVKDVLVSVAGRYEDYETFGNTLNGKLATRWQATSNVALRGSISTGFRAPTVGQANIRNVTTAFTDGKLADRLTAPPTHPAAAEKGAKPLKPEKSFNVSAGTVLNVGKLAVTIDYYRVKVQDRIGPTDNLALCEVNNKGLPLSDNRCQNIRERLEKQGVSDASSLTSVRYFTNAFDTTTQGVDVVATYPMQLASGDTLLTFAGNWNQTDVNKFDPKVISHKRIIQLEENLPHFRFSLTADHRRGPWRFLTRLHYYDDFVEFHADTYTDRIDAAERWLVDLEGSYTFKSGITLATGAQNLFDTYPTQNPYAGETGAKYPESSPYGFNGGFYYFRALYAF